MTDLFNDVSKIEEMHFIADIALFFERMGMPRMAGKILGVLLIAHPPAQSITEIGESSIPRKAPSASRPTCSLRTG